MLDFLKKSKKEKELQAAREAERKKKEEERQKLAEQKAKIASSPHFSSMLCMSRIAFFFSSVSFSYSVIFA